MSFREQKRLARMELHRRMAVPAIHIAPGPSGATTPCTVRVHTQFAALGQIRRSDAEVIETVPTAVLLRDEITPARNDILSIAIGEAYRITNVHPADDITVTVEVVRLDTAETSGLPVPGA